MQKDTVIVIKSVDFSEADKILTVFGRNFGKYTIFARGIRRIESKNRGNMQTLSVSKITFFEGQNMGNLVESESLLAVDFNLERIKNVERLLFLLNKLIPENEPDETVFKKVVEIVKNDFDASTLNKFRINFLRSSGILPEPKRCYLCGKETSVQYINWRELAPLCSDCYYAQNEDVLTKYYSKISEINYGSGDVTEVIDDFIKHQLEDF